MALRWPRWPARAAALSLLLLAVLGQDAARRDSATYDEALHVVSGYSFLRTGIYWMDVDHPPLVRVLNALPLLRWSLDCPTDHPAWRLRQRYEYADHVLYHNRVDPETLLRAARWVSILFALALGALVWIWAGELFGPAAAAFAVAAFAFNPVVLSHGHLANNDMGVAFFFTLALYLLRRFLGDPTSPVPAAAAGAACAAAVVSKFTALTLGPIAAGLWLWRWWRSPAQARLAARRLPWLLLAAAATVVLAYRVHETPVFFEGVVRIFKNVSLGRAAFLLGNYSREGWPHYYITAFLVKTPLPLLALLAFSLAGLRRSPNREELLVWVYFPSALLLAVLSAGRLQTGFRYLLPAYPLLCLAAGEAAWRLWNERGRWGRGLAAGLGAWALAATLVAHPSHLAYFNELAGGSRNGYRWLLDSNLDWGQELKSLGEFARGQGVGGLYLSYFGTADPHAYGMRYRPVHLVSNVPRYGDPDWEPRREAKVLIAVSATNLQGLYYPRRETFAWLKGRKPAAVLGHSLFVYDITGDAAAHAQLARLMREAGRTEAARRESSWAKELERARLRQ